MNPLEQQITEALQSGEIAPEDALAAVQQLMEDPEALARQQQQDAEDRRQRLSALGLRLASEAQTQVSLRQMTEERWYKDVRQFNGQYATARIKNIANKVYGLSGDLQI